MRFKGYDVVVVVVYEHFPGSFIECCDMVWWLCWQYSYSAASILQARLPTGYLDPTAAYYINNEE